MKKFLSVVALLIVAAVVAVVVNDKLGNDSTVNDGASIPDQQQSASPNADATTTPADDDSVGTVNVTFRGTSGSDHVSCGALNTEFLVTPNDGRIRWTALASGQQTSTFPFVGARLPGVTLQPASGVLDPGQSQVIHVGGAFDGSTFYVVVEAPNRSGSGGATIAFVCQ